MWHPNWWGDLTSECAPWHHWVVLKMLNIFLHPIGLWEKQNQCSRSTCVLQGILSIRIHVEINNKYIDTSHAAQTALVEHVKRSCQDLQDFDPPLRKILNNSHLYRRWCYLWQQLCDMWCLFGYCTRTLSMILDRTWKNDLSVSEMLLPGHWFNCKAVCCSNMHFTGAVFSSSWWKCLQRPQ